MYKHYIIVYSQQEGAVQVNNFLTFRLILATGNQQGRGEVEGEGEGECTLFLLSSCYTNENSKSREIKPLWKFRFRHLYFFEVLVLQLNIAKTDKSMTKSCIMAVYSHKEVQRCALYFCSFSITSDESACMPEEDPERESHYIICAVL